MAKLYFIKLYPAAWLLLWLLTVFSVKAETYFVSLSGKDTNSGTSIPNAWATIDQINAVHLMPGDTVLFEGGSIFNGGIYIGADQKGQLSLIKGTATKPIVFSSFGSGHAIIHSGKNAGFKAYNAAGFKIENLIFKGAGSTTNESCGIEFYTDVADTLLEYVYLDHVEVAGYREAGIAIASWDQTTGGFKDVSITNSSSHDNGDAGIVTYAQGYICHKNVYVAYNKVFNNSGLPDKSWNHSGSGIMLGGVDQAVIEYCEAYNNGWLNKYARAGPIGIWGYHCNNLLIQYNESHNNKTNSRVDGGGFDIDGGCTGCIIQYNYSHDNDGAGYVVSQYKKAPPMDNIIVRYNISENDARKNNFGSILLWTHSSSGGITNAEIYNNTVYLTPSKNGLPSALWVDVNPSNAINIRNNILVTLGKINLITLTRSAGTRFQGNNYWSSSGDFSISWSGKSYTSLEHWQTATNQENLNGRPTGYSIDPELRDPGRGTIIGNPIQLYKMRGYALKESSGLIGKGLNLTREFGIDIGKFDFFGNHLHELEEFTVGAFQLPDGTPLSAMLSSFTATRQDEAALLEWETVYESNSLGFGIEVSLDETTFRPLGFIIGKAPNSSLVQNYSFLDTEPAKTGNRHYRLRLVNLDSTATYSAVQSLAFERDILVGIQVYPNPFSKELTLVVTAEKPELLALTLTDPLGRTIVESSQLLRSGKNTLRLSMPPQYSTGLYLLAARQGEKQYLFKLIYQQN